MSSPFLIHHLKQKVLSRLENETRVHKEGNSKKLNPKLAVGEVIYISENGGKTGLNTEEFV